jgi:sugar phosphate isomerase/epimerase
LEQVNQAGLHVSGIHSIGRFYFDGNLSYAKRAVDFTRAVNSKYMLVSGESPEGSARYEVQAVADVLNQVGEFCRDQDIVYCYHNHWWEIQNDQEELRAICELTDPELVSLCLDIGWVKRAGASVVDVTKDFLDRIQYFHLKDTKDEAFTDLGDGEVDFPAFFDLIRGKGEFYLTHERDEVLPNALESAKKSRDYLKGLGV